MNLVAAELGLPENKFSFSFQSRLVKRSLVKTIYRFSGFRKCPAEGIKKLLVVCPAFVSDCLETLEEIEIRGKESFLASGGTEYAMIPCLNTHPLWVKTLADWVSD